MTGDQSMEIAQRVLAGFGYDLTESPRLGVDSWQVFYWRNGEIVSAFMDDSVDLRRSAEQLRVAIQSAI
jgi:hypothetical protein